MSGFGRIGAAFFVALSVGLAGCGGGGGSDDDSPPDPGTPKAEGAYAYSNANGSGGLLLVLENDELWGTYWLGDGTHAGFVQGTGSSTGNTYTAADVRDYDFVDAIIRTLSISAQFDPGVALNVTGTPITPAGDPFTLNATSADVVGYSYEQSASSTAVAGNWAGFFGRTTEAVSAAVSAQGAVDGRVDGTNCSFGGSIRPRPSGKNVFDTELSFGPDCGGLANATTRGITIVSTDSQELVLLTRTADRNVGLTLIATRR
ncbi:MAG: hypothetical protein GX644_03245 [Limnobacter sp.]|nr:hypothetical protein [Limnobacter sp.]